MSEEVKAPERMTAKEHSDQWKRGGICAVCRRKEYCKTQCRANRDYASVRIREYIRRRLGMFQANDGGNAE